MASGVEIASLILGILPLVVQRCEDYAKGLETIKNMRGRRWRREMNRYAARLGAEGVIFKNSLKRLIEDVLVVEVDVRSMESEEMKKTLGRKEFADLLEDRLGNDRYIYWQNLRMLSDNLTELRSRLRIEENIEAELKSQMDGAKSLPSWRGEPSFRESFWDRQLSKFRLMFSKEIYDALLAGVSDANSAFRTMTNDFVQTQTKNRRKPSAPIQREYYHSARTSAKALWSALVQHSMWGCGKRHRHRVELSLHIPGAIEHAKTGATSRTTLNMMMLSDVSSHPGPSQQPCFDKEIEAVPVTVRESQDPVLGLRQDELGQAAEAHKEHDKDAATTQGLSSILRISLSSTTATRKLSDICSELFLSPKEVEVGHAYGFIESAEPGGHRHDLKFSRNLLGDRVKKPLRTALSRSIRPQTTMDLASLGLWANKLSVAASLATSLLIFQGNWLRDPWTFDDLVVVEEAVAPDNGSRPARIFLERIFPECLPLGKGRHNLSHENPRQRSRTLLPLGLALVELALGEPLADLRDPEDIGLSDIDGDLKTATRFLDYVLLQCGFTYRSVVERCLFWNGIDLDDLDDEAVQETIHEDIVQPLLQHLHAMRGSAASLVD